ncbi:terminase [uncultured Enterovirga sp.]|uniref:terminase n=1 Tax=uncultured Enterovirga sp. TaxID=2026352 RepID=UPI0035CAFA45
MPEKAALVPVVPIQPIGALRREPAVDRAIGTHDELADFLAQPRLEQMRALDRELRTLPDHEYRLVADVLRNELAMPWLPIPGPQTAALTSQADILLYGGAAAGGKTQTLIGASAENHERALIVRRQSTELDGIIADSRTIFGRIGEYNKVEREWTLQSGASIKFGGMKEAEDWRAYAGRARDFMGFDEAAEFLEEQVGSILAWLRSSKPGQRCRAILASNPPRGAEGEWLLRWFAPWLDPAFASPALPGELRWCVRVGNDTIWIDDPQLDAEGRAAPILIEGEEYTPLSRTFIPARLDDNPFLAGTNYRAGLQNLPEPLRSQLLNGDFLAGRQDDDWQVIPTEWLKLAQARWTETPPPGRKMTSLGVDLAYGGSDETIVQARFGTWFPHPRAIKGDTKDGSQVAAQVFFSAKDGCEIVLDVGGGYAAGVIEHFKGMELAVTSCNFAGEAIGKSRDGLRFRNKRAELWWGLREALDPNGGDGLALPPDPALIADLTAPRWKLKTGGVIQIEDKEQIRGRLGRSPDRGDALVMARAYGSGREMARSHGAQVPTVNLGYATAKYSRNPGRPNAQPAINYGYTTAKRR